MIDQSNGVIREEQQQTRTFNPNEHLIQIKSGQTSKDYLQVQWRLVWFRSACPHGTIETEMLHLDVDRDTEEEAFAWNAEKRRSEKIIKHAKGFAIFRAIVKDGQGGIATGTKSEKAASFPDFIEKAETGAIGRALAALGYGTQFAPDLDEMPRIVDAPVASQPVQMNGNSTITSTTRTVLDNNAATSQREQASATEQQLAAISRLRTALGQQQPEDESLTFIAAKKLIVQLSAEYNSKQQNNKAS